MITPKTPKKSATIRGFLFKTLLFDAAMRITPPLSIFAFALAGAAIYKVSPDKAKKTIKSTVLDLRNQLSDWVKPNVDDGFTESDYVYECSNDDVDIDDKSYPPEAEQVLLLLGGRCKSFHHPWSTT